MIQWWFNVGPPYATLAHHQITIEPTCRQQPVLQQNTMHSSNVVLLLNVKPLQIHRDNLLWQYSGFARILQNLFNWIVSSGILLSLLVIGA